MTTRRLIELNQDTLGELPAPCRSCTFWERVTDECAADPDGCAAKRAWVSDTLLEWGSCGRLLVVDDRTVGHVLFAPSAYVPRAGAFAVSPAGADALVITALAVHEDVRDRGYGRVLVQAAVAQAVRHRLGAVEAFGSHLPARGEVGCVVPAAFWLAVGFRTVRAHPLVSRLRLDTRVTATWRAEVGSAVSRLVGSMHPAVPAG